MKKLFSLIASLVLVLGLTGCGLKETTGVTLEELETKEETVEVLDIDEASYFTKIGAINKSMLDKTYEVGDKITLSNYEVSGRTYAEKENEDGKIKLYPVVRAVNVDYVKLPTSDMKFSKTKAGFGLEFMFRTNIGDFFKDADGNAYFTNDKLFRGYVDTTYFIDGDIVYNKPTAYVMINGYKIEYVDASDSLVWFTKE